jgi:hypothetical protein
MTVTGLPSSSRSSRTLIFVSASVRLRSHFITFDGSSNPRIVIVRCTPCFSSLARGSSGAGAS